MSHIKTKNYPKLINSNSDYHMHSCSFSDGLSTVDTIVEYAGKFGLEKICITDHSDAVTSKVKNVTYQPRSLANRWKNVINNVEVSFGVEGDILNVDGDICTTIQDRDNAFVVLSLHNFVFSDTPLKTEAYLNAIERHHKKIDVLGHLCISNNDGIDIKTIVNKANEFDIPIEVNGANLLNGTTNLKSLSTMLNNVNKIYVNSDSHTLYELKYARQRAFNEISKILGSYPN